MEQLQRQAIDQLGKHIEAQMQPAGMQQGVGDEAPQLQTAIRTIDEQRILRRNSTNVHKDKNLLEWSWLRYCLKVRCEGLSLAAKSSQGWQP